MKKITLSLAVVAVFAFGASAAFAANTNLVNGGIGQRAGDTSNFGFSLCNNGSADVTSAVPVAINVNNISVNTQSAASIPAGTCSYSYLPYASLSMTAGNTYSVNVAINGASPSSYTVTVPGTTGGAVLGASATTPNQSTLSLMASEIQLLNSLIAKLQAMLAAQ